MNQQEIETRLQHLNEGLEIQWEFVKDRLTKQFTFSSFEEALNFMLRVSRHVEALNHHPEWCNIYNTVSIELITHRVSGVSQLDFSLAIKIEEEYCLANR